MALQKLFTNIGYTGEPYIEITYKKWWHRFLPYYRKRIKLMNILFAHEWKNGLGKKTDEEIRNKILKSLTNNLK